MDPHPRVLIEHAAEFQIPLLTCFIKMATSTSHLRFPHANVPSALPNINLFTFPPKSEASVFDSNQLGFPAWRQNSRLVPSSSGDKGDWLRLHHPCPPCTVGGVACTVLSLLLSTKIPRTWGKAGSSSREPRFNFQRQLIQCIFIYDEGFVKQVLSDLEKKGESPL